MIEIITSLFHLTLQFWMLKFLLLDNEELQEKQFFSPASIALWPCYFKILILTYATPLSSKSKAYFWCNFSSLPTRKPKSAMSSATHDFQGLWHSGHITVTTLIILYYSHCLVFLHLLSKLQLVEKPITCWPCPCQVNVTLIIPHYFLNYHPVPFSRCFKGSLSNCQLPIPREANVLHPQE